MVVGVGPEAGLVLVDEVVAGVPGPADHAPGWLPAHGPPASPSDEEDEEDDQEKPQKIHGGVRSVRFAWLNLSHAGMITRSHSSG